MARAIAALPESGATPTAISRLYASAPVGLRGRWFYNGVVRAATALSPSRLWRQLQQLELALGRRHLGPGFEPRVIDLDLLAGRGWRLHAPELTLPHPAIPLRRFVLLGLRETGGPLPAAAAIAPAVGRQPLHVIATGAWWRIR